MALNHFRPASAASDGSVMRGAIKRSEARRMMENHFGDDFSLLLPMRRLCVYVALLLNYFVKQM